MKLIKIIISIFIILIIFFFIKEYIAYKVAMPFDYDFNVK
jgi:hypothetical protein|tara:strand:+ start:1123 stop:1242 length:120 start_codon:yes stop_codon:yes gene_type:complete